MNRRIILIFLITFLSCVSKVPKNKISSYERYARQGNFQVALSSLSLAVLEGDDSFDPYVELQKIYYFMSKKDVHMPYLDSLQVKKEMTIKNEEKHSLMCRLKEEEDKSIDTIIPQPGESKNDLLVLIQEFLERIRLLSDKLLDVKRDIASLNREISYYKREKDKLEKKIKALDGIKDQSDDDRKEIEVLKGEISLLSDRLKDVKNEKKTFAEERIRLKESLKTESNQYDEFLIRRNARPDSLKIQGYESAIQVLDEALSKKAVSYFLYLYDQGNLSLEVFNSFKDQFLLIDGDCRSLNYYTF